MVEVFKTNVDQGHEALMLISALAEHMPEYRINFDLEDCDRILRVEGNYVLPEGIINVLDSKGYECHVLDS